MQIRQAQENDLEEVIRLYRQLNPGDPPLDPNVALDTWRQILSNRLIHLYVVEDRPRLISTCILTIIPNLTRGCSPYGLIENVVTDQDFRRKGIGARLLKYALKDAWKSGCYKVMLLTGSKRPETLNFYQNAGFQAGKKTAFVAYPTVD